MDLFTSRLDAERLDRITDPARRASDRAAVLAALKIEAVEDSAGSRWVIAYVGSETPRERIWLQFDACADDVPTAIASWAAVESLASERTAQHRNSVVGRARVAVVFAEHTLTRIAPASVPFLDAGSLGVRTPLMEVMHRFGPSLVLHVQDWSTDASAPLCGRLVESFKIDSGVHAALPRAGSGRRFSAGRRAYRSASTGADWIVGARTLAYVRRLGHTVRDLEASRTTSPGVHTVHAIAPGRYLPSLPYRRLGGGNLGELALGTSGAHALTLQMRGGSALERASFALAIAEGAIVNRMGLIREEDLE